MSITNPLASLFGQAVSGTQQPALTAQAHNLNQLGGACAAAGAVSGTQQPALTAQAHNLNQLGGACGGGAYYPAANQAALQQAMYNQASAFDNKKYKLLEEERDLLLNNEGLQELAKLRKDAEDKYQAFLALLRK